QGVGPETATLPAGWEDRWVKVQNANTDLKIGYCLEPHDLAASKLVAGREKDGQFVATMLAHHIVNRTTLSERIEMLPVSRERRDQLQRWLSQH
ncbi:DUF6036 family nucleotidyltransferase, partial [Arthrospira platensis SPKY1]|nr:DUF6036 family nucleotidyltransferase [Arthrospira platensis SPKY1]